MKTPLIIAIDGPVASGKGTIANHLAKKLNGFDLYTGATYRCLALFCIENNIDLKNEHEIVQVIPTLVITLGNDKVVLNGCDVTNRIQEQAVANAASTIGVYPKVRESLVELQRAIAKTYLERGVTIVAEGRDIATVVFPNAPVKLFLTATVAVRAKRRMEQYRKLGKHIRLEQVTKDISKRDARDSGRSIDPLPTNPTVFGYTVIDTSKLTQEETIAQILGIIHSTTHDRL